MLLSLVAFACGPGGDGTVGDDDDDGGGNGDVVAIEVSPPDAVVTVQDGVPGSQPYTALARLVDGSTVDVTAMAAWGVDDARLGGFTGATFTAGGALGGRTVVRALPGGAQGMVPVTVRVAGGRVIDPAPAGAPGLFAGATEDPGRAPAIVYPSTGTMVPANLGDFEVHWTDAAGNDLFEVTLRSEVLDLRVYVASPGSGWVAFAPAEWAIAGETTRGETLEVGVRGLSTTAPASAGTAAPLAIAVAPEDVEGGIYYWAASASGIYRHDFGQPGMPAQPYYTPAESGGRCVACHGLSRDGTRMALTFDGGNGEATVVDVATRAPLYPAGSLLSNFTVFEPSGARFIATRDGVLTLRDTATSAVITTVPTGAYATHPDFAPQGDKICWVAVGSPGSDWSFTGGRIMVQPFDAASGTFGAATELVPAGAANLYYPTFSPDGAWILFNQAAGTAYDNVDAQVWVVPTDGSRAPALVASANSGGGLTNSWVRWAPFIGMTEGEMGEPYYWFTFSSKRVFGVRKPGGVTPQIWMAPFFPGRAAAGADPSLPAFRLPFQDLATSNHIAQWTETVVPID